MNEIDKLIGAETMNEIDKLIGDWLINQTNRFMVNEGWDFDKALEAATLVFVYQLGKSRGKEER